MSSATETPVWEGTSRYAVRRRIGEGGMGVVYEAYDRERRQLVALKTLQNFSPTTLYRFKQEFRTLADVSHPNLVRLYELVASGDGAPALGAARAVPKERVFFAMELVDGRDFLAHVRRPDAVPPDRRAAGSLGELVTGPFPAEPRDGTSERAELITARQPHPPAPRTEHVAAAKVLGRSPADFDRLRPALAQLVEGVHALHAAGKLHRDIKPSNVRVTAEGRVVLLDFGVATELGTVVDENLAEHEIVGTARYMAPEQSRRAALTAASDWYSVGVMLYQALVGEAPFVGPALDVLARKVAFDPVPPRDRVGDVPADLDALCGDLLRRDPAARPSGTEVLRRVRGQRESTPAPAMVAPAGVTLVGRETHLAALRAAFEQTRAGQCVTVRVHGASGMGKTALVQRFLDDLVAGGAAVALRGRAYERESVPYKAFDSVVDALSRYLRRLAEKDISIRLPRDVWALARLFPVLRRVAAIDAAPEPVVDDLQYVRRRAFVALRELLAWLARRQPIVVWIDDLQWGDVDSAALLLEMVRPPHAPPLLVLATHQEDGQGGPLLRELRARWPARAELRDVEVGPLAVDDARRLASTLLAHGSDAAPGVAESIARESGGSAFLVGELARGAASVRRADGPVTLEAVLGERLTHVPEAARRLLEIVAVAARPLDVEVAGASASVHAGLDEHVALLRGAHLVRTGLRDGREVIETIHDRVRAVMVARISPPALRDHHRRLARILEGLPSVDPEALALHFLGAGETHSAARHAERAAEHAFAKLAFDQAARLYALTLEIAHGSRGAVALDVRRLRVRRAEALKLAGRAQAAAEGFHAAALDAPALERVDLEREAAEQLIMSGHIDEGIAAMRGVLRAVGMKLPGSPLRALLLLAFYRAWLWLRGMRFTEREPGDLRAEERARIDVCHAATVGLSLVDAIDGACMQARHLLLALRAGDRLRLVRALTLERAHIAARGGPEPARGRALAVVARRLAEHTGEREARMYVEALHGFACFLRGEWQAAREACDAVADASLDDARAGWRNNVNLFAVWSLVLLGDIVEVTRRVPALMADAEDRGDLHAAVNLRLGFTNVVWLAEDDVDEARRQIARGMAAWSHRGFYLQHFRALVAEANVELYAGDHARAYALVTERWRDLERSQLLRVQIVRAEAHFLRGRCALASLEPRNADARLAEAARSAARLDGEGMPWTVPLARLVSAGIAQATGDRAATERHLRAAIAGAGAAGMSMHVATARFRLGAHLASDEGRELRDQAADWMSAQGIRAPTHLAAMIAPWSMRAR